MRRPSLAASLLVVALLPALLAPAPAAAGIHDLDAEEVAAIEALNALRVDLGLTPLAVSPILTEAAEWMAADLAGRDLLDHTDSLGRDLGERVSSFGYPGNSVIRENLAAGFETGAAVVQGWQDSPGHRANNEADDVVAVGIARVFQSGTTYGWFWALNFGSQADAGTVALDELLAGAVVSGIPPLGTDPGTFTEDFPDAGIGLTAWNGGSLETLAEGAREGGAQAVFVTHQGSLYGYRIGAPAFVNAAFRALFPGGHVPAGTLLIIVV